MQDIGDSMPTLVFEDVGAYEVSKRNSDDRINDVEKIGIFLIKTVGEKVLYCMYQAFENHCSHAGNYADYPTYD